MGESEFEVLRDQYDAVNERDWTRAMSHYADDVEMVIAGSGIRTGRFKGKEEVGRWFGEWFATFDRSLGFRIRDLRKLDDGAILLIAESWMKGRASGIALQGDAVWRYRVRGGKIAEIEGWESVSDVPEEIRAML